MSEGSPGTRRTRHNEIEKNSHPFETALQAGLFLKVWDPLMSSDQQTRGWRAWIWSPGSGSAPPPALPTSTPPHLQGRTGQKLMSDLLSSTGDIPAIHHPNPDD